MSEQEKEEKFELTYFELSYAVELLYMAYKMIPTEPHGQNFDAYALYQKFVKEAVRREKEWQHEMHGVWELRPPVCDIGGKQYECSVCGKRIEVSEDKDVIEELPYCFGCGARMRKGE